MYVLNIDGEDIEGTEHGSVTFEEAPDVSISFPGEEGITGWQCSECGWSTQDESDLDNPSERCSSGEGFCDTCAGDGEISRDLPHTSASTGSVFTPDVEVSECPTCAGTGEGKHVWQTEPHSWLNSARIGITDDAVYVAISIGDPRGAFVMRVENIDGELRLSVPTPSDGILHLPLKPLNDGYYAIGS